MTRIEKEQEKDDSHNVYYIPYLSVVRPDALTTKLRNVFNASSKTSNGISLNDTMWEGPKLQTSIKDIILTARSFRFIYSADISMMFRQIQVLPEDRNKLRIIWRPCNTLPLQEYRLNTVTYGTDAAPFLAIRTIHQCAEDNAPAEIAEIIKKSFYVDDLLYGSDTIQQAQHLITQIKSTLAKGQLPLTKWMSNNDEVLVNIPETERLSNFTTLNKKVIKTLGIPYDYVNDEFLLNFKNPDPIQFTKRGISSASASFYDPLGFILPFIMILRLFLQKVWKLKVEWDEYLIESCQAEFKALIKGIENLNTVRIPRFLPASDDNTIELIGFSDASSHAYAAVIYSRLLTHQGYKITLVTSKGNVSKFKNAAVLNSQQQTIPKLELEALLTLANLYDNVRSCFIHRNIKFTAYTDSQVVLAWIRNSTKIDKKFVERRTTKIKKIIDPKNLHYVKSEENPADPASRGLSAEALSTCKLWFCGPSWLQQHEIPTTPYCEKVNTFTTTSVEPEEDMFARFSSWTRILRVTAICLRWRYTAESHITAAEIQRSKIRVIRYYQNLYLAEVMANLRKKMAPPKRHWLYRLSPFLDSNEVLRVGGRLGNAAHITDGQRHPIVIPKSHCMQVLVNFTHQNNCHAGNALMLRILIEEYWLPGIKAVIQSCVRKCTKCIRWNAKAIQPEMSQLPAERVMPSATFDRVGVDLSGPYIIKASALKFDRTMKIWVANFVCLSTKATHLEIVSSLSTEHFLAALSRFCSRRGTCCEIWSDNGTNLVGANRALRETWQKIVKDCDMKTAMQEISWKFIPRHSPTFGGLWEACVKSMKYFVKRMMGTRNLTYEEFNTLLCRIEALMNSRPLFKNPLNPVDEPALTPFHFITQRAHKPTSIDGAEKIPLTKKWYTIHRIQLEFWERFRVEYLRELQTKIKWQKPQPNLAINDVVLIKEPSVTPGNWKMGTVSKVYPDPKGVVRKVDVSTPSKENSQHAVNKLIPLLKEEELDAKPLKRTSPRGKSKITLVHLCLLVMMVSIPAVRSNPIDLLVPGVNVRDLPSVWMKAFDIKFTVKTNINLTKDLDLIQTTSDEFQNECQTLSGRSKMVMEKCESLKLSMSKLAQQCSMELLDSYKMRSKRWLGITVKGVMKTVPYVVTTLGIVYEEVQIHNLQQDLKATKAKVHKTANILLNITDLEYEAVEGKLNEIIDKQEEILLVQTITNYAQNIELLFERLKTKHNEIQKIRPLSELKDFCKEMLANMVNMELPDIGNDIFEIFTPTKFIKDDYSFLSFNIPIVKKQRFNVFILISVPFPDGDTVLLSSNNQFQRIAVDNITMTAADVTETLNLHRELIDTTPLVKMNDCLVAILEHRSSINICRHEQFEGNHDSILEVYPDLIAVFATYDNSAHIECNNTQEIITSTVLINTTLCAVTTSARAWGLGSTIYSSLESNETQILPKVDSTVQHILQDHRINELKSLIRSNEDIEATTSNWDTITLVIFVIGSSLFISLSVVAFRCCVTPQRRRTVWFPEWDGPRQQEVTL